MLEERLKEIGEQINSIEDQKAALEREQNKLKEIYLALDILRNNPAETRLLPVYLRNEEKKG